MAGFKHLVQQSDWGRTVLGGFMQALLNRTSEITENLYGSAMSALSLATYFGFSYIALSMLTSFVSRLVPAANDANSSAD